MGGRTGCLCERHRKKRGITSVAVNKKNIQLYYLILFILNLNIFYVHTVYTYRTVHLYDNTYHTTTLVPIIDKKSFLRLKRWIIWIIIWKYFQSLLEMAQQQLKGIFDNWKPHFPEEKSWEIWSCFIKLCLRSLVKAIFLRLRGAGFV